ncbi:unnamed protein product [Amoebophrya sp. A25]|nr:unnamed protein product [Amoebophrya sp. A25]|eukprot:GSA25T00011185001.1
MENRHQQRAPSAASTSDRGEATTPSRGAAPPVADREIIETTLRELLPEQLKSMNLVLSSSSSGAVDHDQQEGSFVPSHLLNTSKTLFPGAATRANGENQNTSSSWHAFKASPSASSEQGRSSAGSTTTTGSGPSSNNSGSTAEEGAGGGLLSASGSSSATTFLPGGGVMISTGDTGTPLTCVSSSGTLVECPATSSACSSASADHNDNHQDLIPEDSLATGGATSGTASGAFSSGAGHASITSNNMRQHYLHEQLMRSDVIGRLKESLKSELTREFEQRVKGLDIDGQFRHLEHEYADKLETLATRLENARSGLEERSRLQEGECDEDTRIGGRAGTSADSDSDEGSWSSLSEDEGGGPLQVKNSEQEKTSTSSKPKKCRSNRNRPGKLLKIDIHSQVDGTGLNSHDSSTTVDVSRTTSSSRGGRSKRTKYASAPDEKMARRIVSDSGCSGSAMGDTRTYTTEEQMKSELEQTRVEILREIRAEMKAGLASPAEGFETKIEEAVLERLESSLTSRIEGHLFAKISENVNEAVANRLESWNFCTKGDLALSESKNREAVDASVEAARLDSEAFREKMHELVLESRQTLFEKLQQELKKVQAEADQKRTPAYVNDLWESIGTLASRLTDMQQLLDTHLGSRKVAQLRHIHSPSEAVMESPVLRTEGAQDKRTAPKADRDRRSSSNTSRSASRSRRPDHETSSSSSRGQGRIVPGGSRILVAAASRRGDETDGLLNEDRSARGKKHRRADR